MVTPDRISGEYKEYNAGLKVLTSFDSFLHDIADITAFENGRGRVCDQVDGEV